MKKIVTSLMILLCSFSVFSGEKLEPTKDNRDLTHFDYPFLLGNWKLHPEQAAVLFGHDVFFRFDDDYRYTVKNVRDGLMEGQLSGNFEVEDNFIILYSDVDPSYKEKLPFDFNYNIMKMNNYVFNKTAPHNLIGKWKSKDIGSVEEEPQMENVNVVFDPSFVFMLEIEEKNGEKKVQTGVYTVVDNNMLLFFSNGQNAVKFKLEDEDLLLDIEDGALLSRLAKII